MIESLNSAVAVPWATGSPEFDLLLTCSRTHLNRTHLSHLQTLLQADLDWPKLVDTATYHGVNHLLYWQLLTHSPEAMPIAIREAEQDALRANCDRNLALLTELIRLNKVFAAKNLSLLSFKGLTLTHRLYSQLALRAFKDIDILVPDVQAVQAMQLLIAQGYEPQFVLTPNQQIRYIQTRHEMSFWNANKQVAVDLHWVLMPQHYSFAPSSNLVWQSAETLSIADRSILTLSQEALILYLCAHGAQHDWNKLFWICDIAELLRQSPTLNWDWVTQQINRFGTETMLFLGLALAHEVLDAPLPDTIQQKIMAKSYIRDRVVQVKAILLQQKKTNDTSIPTNRIYFQTIESPRDKMWSWCDAILTPTPLEWQIITLPKPLFPLYYIIRMIRLVVKYAVKVRSH
jgi:hypothetical protein